MVFVTDGFIRSPAGTQTHDHSTTAQGGAVPESSITSLVSDLAAKAGTTLGFLTWETTASLTRDRVLSFNSTHFTTADTDGGGYPVSRDITLVANQWNITFDIWTGSFANTNWDTIFCNTGIESELITNGMLTSSGVEDDSISFKTFIFPGTYTFRLMHWQDANRGRYHLLFNEAAATSLSGSADYIEGYAAADVPNRRDSITGIVIPNPGAVYVVKLKMDTQNGAATGFYGCIQSMSLVRTA